MEIASGGETQPALTAELNARIAFQEKSINSWSAGVDSDRTAEIARSRTSQAWFDIAVCRIMLGQASSAREAFLQAANWAKSTLEVVRPRGPMEYGPELTLHQGAVESAVLSGDRSLASALAAIKVEPGPRPSLIGDRLAWAQALPALVAGNDALAGQFAETASEVPEKKAWYPGLGEAIGAIVSEDVPALTEAIERVLAKHVRYARNRSSHCHNWGPCLICIPAAVLIRLSAWRGITLNEPRGRRAKISFHLMISRPGERVDIQADFLTDSLTGI